jgi:pimeloyl-ACP methyl ester carboxylesterase
MFCKKIRVFISLFVFFILTFTCLNDLWAIDFLSNDFSFVDLETNWLFVHGSGNTDNSWRIEDDLLVGEVNKNSSSYLFSKKSDLSNFTLEFESLNYSGVDQEVLFRVSSSKDKYYMLNLRFNDMYWPQDGGEIVLWKYFNNNYYKLISINPNNFNINLTQNNFHKIKIICNNSNIDILFDGEKIISYVDDDSFLVGGVGFLNWGGNYYRRSTKNAFTNLEVKALEQDKRNKIVVIPGLGASWNFNSIFLNKDVANNDWKMTPLVKAYNPIIYLLEKNDLKNGDDFFVWNYDWTKSVEDISNDLDLFIQKNIDNEEKIDLIGHSLGGLVARIWAQSNTNKIGNLITFGSPHKGSLDVYEVWNGGKISKINDLSSLIMQVFLVFKNKGLGTTDLNNIRLFAPVLKDLLPTENYIVKNNQLLDNSDLETENKYLFNKNLDFIEKNISFNSVVGVGFSTPSLTELKNRSVFDNILGIWPDGRPISYNYLSGDKTVLESSALFNSNDFIKINSNHTQIIKDGINYLSNNLRLSEFISNKKEVNYSNGLFLFMGSPAKLEVTCGDDVYIDNDGFIFIEDKNYHECMVKIKPTDNGKIHLVFGNTSNLDWHYLEKTVSLNKDVSFYLNFNNASILQKKDNYPFLKSLIIDDLASLGLIKEIKYFERGRLQKVINNVFIYRKKNNEHVVTQRILKNLYTVSLINCNSHCSSRNKDIFWLKKYKLFLERLVNLRIKKGKLGKSSVLSLIDLDNFIELAGNTNTVNSRILHKISISYGKEILKK